MGAETEINKVALTIRGGTNIHPYFIVHYLYLEWIPSKHISEGSVIVLFTSQCVVGPDMFLHLFLNFLEISVSNRVHLEVVIKSIFDRRSDGGLGIRINFYHCLSQ